MLNAPKPAIMRPMLDTRYGKPLLDPINNSHTSSIYFLDIEFFFHRGRGVMLELASIETNEQTSLVNLLYI